MCYLIAKKTDKSGCIALRTTHGQRLVDLKRKLREIIGDALIELITISRPSAYCEYEPYHFVNSEEDFWEAIRNIAENGGQNHEHQQ